MEKLYYICVIIGDFMKLDDFILDEKKFESIEKQAEIDLNGMPDNIKDAMDYNAFQLPNIQFEWSRRFKRQKYVVESLKDELKKLWGEKVEFYKFKSQYHWDTTKEIESQIECDMEWCKRKKLYQIQCYYLESIEQWYELIKKLDYKIHDYLDYKKMELTNF